jgi:hypothetical protein
MHSTMLGPRVLILHISTAALDPRVDFFAGTVAGAYICEPVEVDTPEGTHSGPCMHSSRPGMAALTVGQPFDTGSFTRAPFHSFGC